MTDTNSPQARLPRPLIFVLAVGAVLALLAAVRLIGGGEEAPYLPAVDGRIETSFLPVTELDRLLAAYEERATSGSTPSDFLILGDLALEKGRVTGDVQRFVQAEAAYLRADELLGADLRPEEGLARVALALHDFAGAVETAETILAVAPDRSEMTALLADARLAQGQVGEAERLVDRLTAALGDVPDTVVRQAELAWMRGEVTTAAELADEAVPEEDTNPRRRSWFHAYAAEAAFRAGDLEAAATHAGEALSLHGDSRSARTVSAKVTAASGDLDTAATMYEDLVAEVPTPEHVAALADIYLALGRDADAARQTEVMEVIADLASVEGEVYAREIVRFFADRGLRPDEMLAMASAELEVRSDPAAWETYAWAAHQAGEVGEATEAIERMLATGYASAEALYRAGVIFAATGDTARAQELLAASLDRNPEFHPLHADHARALLAELRG